jgi:hypothetical protein
MLLGEGECTSCKAHRVKIFRISCNLGVLDRCVACIDVAERHNQQLEAKHLKQTKRKKTKKGSKHKYVQILQGGSPGLGK